eukprot:gene3004-3752_t
MSRIGRLPIKLPQGVTLRGPEADVVYVKGPKGELFQQIDPAISVIVEDGMVVLERKSNQKRHKALHGLYRMLINNMIIGVSVGFTKSLELVGVGYKASTQDNMIDFDLGYSHKIYFVVPPEIQVKAETVKGKNPIVHLEGIDKQLLGQIAAKLKTLRKVEPYKGKGIRYVGEQPMNNAKATRRLKIRMRIRKRVQGNAERPRLSVYKSNQAIYAQLINDEQGHTLAASSSRVIGEVEGTPTEKAKIVGEALAKQAIEKGIKEVVFDRSGYLYHGRVKALAEGARAQGLKF